MSALCMAWGTRRCGLATLRRGTGFQGLVDRKTWPSWPRMELAHPAPEGSAAVCSRQATGRDRLQCSPLGARWPPSRLNSCNGRERLPMDPNYHGYVVGSPEQDAAYEKE